jgi:hypothetical protein
MKSLKRIEVRQSPMSLVAMIVLACAGREGAPGQNTSLRTTAELAGANCPTSGTKIEAGPDSNANGTLEESEVRSTAYVCNGIAGMTGMTGRAGTEESSVLQSCQVEAAALATVQNCGDTTTGVSTLLQLGPKADGGLPADPIGITSSVLICGTGSRVSSVSNPVLRSPSTDGGPVSPTRLTCATIR